MRIATDRADVLLQFVEAGIPFANLGLQIFILETEWNVLPQGSKFPLSTFKNMGVLRFIDLEEIFHSDVLCLKRQFGCGISLENYLILSYCKGQGLPILSSDPTLLKVAEQTKIPFKTLDDFRIDLLVESAIAESKGAGFFKKVKAKGKMRSG